MACGRKMLKESIKKSIMMQEEIFKQQVKELHRLYHMQKKLTLEKDKLDNDKEDSDILRRFTSPERSHSHIHNSPITKVGNKATSNVLAVKRPHDDRCEVELSLCIGGKVSNLISDCNSHKLEGETRCCSRSIELGLLSSQSSRSEVKVEISEKNFQQLQLRLSI